MIGATNDSSSADKSQSPYHTTIQYREGMIGDFNLEQSDREESETSKIRISPAPKLDVGIKSELNKSAGPKRRPVIKAKT